MLVFRALVFLNVWVAAGAALLSLQTTVLLELPPQPGIMTFVFFATCFLYNFQRLKRSRFSPPQRALWLSRNRRLQRAVTLLSGTGMLLTAFFLNSYTLVFLIGCGLISWRYALSFPWPQGRKKTLRELPYLKLWLIALIWAAVTVIVPVIHVRKITFSDSGLFLLCFLFIAAITIPFDIRDRYSDSPSMKTLPQQLGVKGALKVSLLLLALAMLLTLWIFPSSTGVALLISFAISGGIIWSARKPQPELFYSGLIDGLLLLQPLLILLFAQC